MRFDKSSKSRRYLNRRDQYRMLALIAGLAAVMVLIKLAGKPESWHWFVVLSGGEQTAEQQPRPPRQKKTTLTPLRRQGNRFLLPDEFTPGPESSSRLSSADDSSGRGKNDSHEPKKTNPVQTDDKSNSEEQTKKPSLAEQHNPPPRGDASPLTDSPREPASLPLDTSHLPEVTTDGQLVLSAELLEPMNDALFRLSKKEAPALKAILEFVRHLSDEEIAAHADDQVTFDVIRATPDYYRGKLVTIQGRAKQLLPFDYATFGSVRDPIEAYQCWITTPDSRGIPYLVLCPEPPEEMPTGRSIDEPVRATGYFIRHFSYPSKKGTSTTLLLIAKRIEWTPSPNRAGKKISEKLETTLLFWALGLGLLVAGLGAWYLWGNHKFRTSHLHDIAESRLDADPKDLADLEKMDSGDPHRIQIPADLEEVNDR